MYEHRAPGFTRLSDSTKNIWQSKARKGKVEQK